MHDRSQLRRTILGLALVTAVLLSLLVASQTLLSMRDHGHSFWRIFGWHLSGWTVWALATPWIVEWLRRPSERGGWALWTRVAAVASLAALVQIPLAAALALVFQPFVPVVTYDFRAALVEQALPLLGADLLVVGLMLTLGVALEEQRRRRDLQLRESRLQAALVQAQLDGLRLQMQPHFLFNTLNSVASLIREARDRDALDMVLGLGELLRAYLRHSRRQFSSLETEIELVERYVDLQRVRFGDRLQVTVEIAPEALSCRFPSLLLQPLVENALRHGIAPLARGGHLEIRARLERDADPPLLRLEIADDGRGLAPNWTLEGALGSRAQGEGVAGAERSVPDAAGDGGAEALGLRNTLRRLDQLYGEVARLEVEPRSGGGTCVRLALPAAPAPLEETAPGSARGETSTDPTVATARARSA